MAKIQVPDGGAPLFKTTPPPPPGSRGLYRPPFLLKQLPNRPAKRGSSRHRAGLGLTVPPKEEGMLPLHAFEHKPLRFWGGLP